MVNENLIKLLEDLASKGITAEDIESAVNKHLYLLTFGSGDFKISTLTNSKVDDHTVYDMTSLTDEDKEFYAEQILICQQQLAAKEAAYIQTVNAKSLVELKGTLTDERDSVFDAYDLIYKSVSGNN